MVTASRSTGVPPETASARSPAVGVTRADPDATQTEPSARTTCQLRPEGPSRAAGPPYAPGLHSPAARTRPAAPAAAVDQTGQAARLGLAPQVHDVHVERVRRRLEVQAPHLPQDLVAGEHLPGVGEEHFEQQVLDAGEVEPVAGPGCLPAQGVHAQVAEGEDAAAALGVRAASSQQRPHPGEQLVEFERLDRVVVRPGVQAGDAIADGVARGQPEDGERVAGRPQAAAGRQPVEPGAS